MKSVCVLLVLLQAQKRFIRSARDLGFAIAKNKLSMVYGGGSKGLMGVVQMQP